MTVVRAVLGTSVTLMCGGGGTVYYQSVSWSRNGSVISWESRGNGSDQLEISEVKWIDNGTYMCSFYSNGRMTEFHYFQLVVTGR